MFRKDSMRIKKQNYKILKNHIIDHLCIKQIVMRTNQVEKIYSQLNALEASLNVKQNLSLNDPSVNIDNTLRNGTNLQSEKRLINNENSILLEMKTVPVKSNDDLVNKDTIVPK
jgi:hypothetical protein